jgi:hypothetical protein
MPVFHGVIVHMQLQFESFFQSLYLAGDQHCDAVPIMINRNLAGGIFNGTRGTVLKVKDGDDPVDSKRNPADISKTRTLKVFKDSADLLL